ncbi:MAG: rRNA pseudouridine synthase [Acidimicrobiia bacterium]|nr:rRNA pseudouridine synthase [Acidimicrobiia bacterium]
MVAYPTALLAAVPDIESLPEMKTPLTVQRSHRAKKGAKDRVTLDRAFSKAGMFSRTEAIKKIHSGAVKVNGKVVRDPDHWVSVLHDSIQCNGRALREQRRICLMLYKPTGVVTSHGDPGQRKTVYDLLTGFDPWVFPVGRLDLDTSGLLIMTNDTTLGERMANPLAKVPKTYQLKVNFHPTPEQLSQLARGIELAPGETTLPAKVRVLRRNDKHSFLELVLVEGRNRQVRRMIEALGGRVMKLVRTRIGNLPLGELPIGHYRVLSRREVAELLKQPDAANADLYASAIPTEDR